MPDNQESDDNQTLEVSMDDARYRDIFSSDRLAFSPVNSSAFFQTQLSSKDIVQHQLGNCYFLSALGSILDMQPRKIDDSIKFTQDGKRFSVTFHCPETNFKMKYHLQATMVMQQQNTFLPYIKYTRSYNAHKDPRISLLEKAYALHRVMWMQADLAKRKSCVLQSYQSCLSDGQSSEVYQALGFNQSTKIQLFRQNRQQIKFKNLITSMLFATMQIFEATEPGELNICKNKLQELLESSDFLSIDNNRSILSEEALDILDTKNNDGANAIADTVFTAMGELENVTAESAFSSQKTLIIDKIRSLCFNDAIIEQLIAQCESVFTTVKRGFIEYSEQQNKHFEEISSALNAQQPCSLGTQESYHKSKPDPSSSDSFEYKGLLGPHQYQILDAYSKEGVKYLLLRNPHARYVRVYTKNPDDSLSAHAARQISSEFWSQDSYDKQQHPTLSYQQFRRYSDAGGVFEIEFNDLNKHQCEVTISPAPSIEDNRSFKYD